jgi:hypothetical protein
VVLFQSHTLTSLQMRWGRPVLQQRSSSFLLKPPPKPPACAARAEVRVFASLVFTVSPSDAWTSAAQERSLDLLVCAPPRVVNLFAAGSTGAS